MNVLLVCHRFPPDGITGVERYTQTLAEYLTLRGDTVTVVSRQTSSGRTRLRRDILPDGTVVYRILGEGVGLNQAWSTHFDNYEALFREILDRVTPDVVHVNHLMNHSPNYLRIASESSAVVLTLHDFYFACPLVHLQNTAGVRCDGPKGGLTCARTCFVVEDKSGVIRWGLRSALYRRLLDLANRVICPSQYMADFFSGRAIDPARIVVVPNGVTRLQQAGSTQSFPGRRGRLNLAYLGAVAPHKGPQVILDALRIANIGPVSLTLLGPISDPGFHHSLCELARKIPNLDFKMHGVYEPSELGDLLSDIDCVVVPSLVPESFSITTREALQMGIPVAASRLGALPEVVQSGINGFTFDPERPVELAEIFHRLLDDENGLATLRAGAIATPVIAFDEHVDRVVDIYEIALREFAQRLRRRSVDVEEFDFLESSLKVLLS